MVYLNALIGLALLVLTGLQFDDENPVRWAFIYFAGAALALLSVVPRLSLNLIRFLAVDTTAMMMFYFAGFFLLVPGLDADWYMKGQGGDALGLLCTGFAMIPVLSAYSCRMKSETTAHQPAVLPPLGVAPRTP